MQRQRGGLVPIGEVIDDLDESGAGDRSDVGRADSNQQSGAAAGYGPDGGAAARKARGADGA